MTTCTSRSLHWHSRQLNILHTLVLSKPMHSPCLSSLKLQLLCCICYQVLFLTYRTVLESSCGSTQFPAWDTDSTYESIVNLQQDQYSICGKTSNVFLTIFWRNKWGVNGNLGVERHQRGLNPTTPRQIKHWTRQYSNLQIIFWLLLRFFISLRTFLSAS